MTKIGNIVSDGTSNGFGNLFNVFTQYSQVDNKLPTLIVGYNKASEIIDNFSILKKEYNNGMLRWTFSKTERRSDYIKDLEIFKEYCMMQKVKGIKYIYIDIISYGYNRIKKLIHYINSNDKKLCFLTRNSNFIFIYSEKYNTIWGLSLTLCDYIGVDKQKVVNKIRKNKTNRFIQNIGIISEDFRKKIGENTHYLLPIYLYFE